MRPLFLALCVAATASPLQAQGRRKGVGPEGNGFADGNRARQRSALENFLHKSEVVAVEVYTSTISVPAQFDRGNGCGSVVVWTRW